MATIAYDQPVKDLIAGLNATGHVTHTTHRKTKVTLHHNAARLTHEGVLEVWKTRPASAQFDVDANGGVAQYVIVNEYAWACGTTPGNEQSISIEMCNSTLSPSWEISETTWKSAARLAGWLFARVIGVRPNSNDLVRHKYWKATECAGPHIDKIYNQVLTEAQKYYDYFAHGIPLENDMQPTDQSYTPKLDANGNIVGYYTWGEIWYWDNRYINETRVIADRLLAGQQTILQAIADGEASDLTTSDIERILSEGVLTVEVKYPPVGSNPAGEEQLVQGMLDHPDLPDNEDEVRALVAPVTS